MMTVCTGDRVETAASANPILKGSNFPPTVRVPSGNTSRFVPSFRRSSHFLTRPRPDLLWIYPASRAVPEKIILRARLPFIRQTARGIWETISTASSRQG